MTYQTKKNTIIIAIAFLAGILAGGKILVDKKEIIKEVIKTKIIHEQEDIYQVYSVIDGDTFKIDENTRVRIMGINSPEKGECYYKEARDALKELIENKTVKLEKDITDKDIYGRLLRYVVLLNDKEDNILVNDYMVRYGYARDYHIAPDKHYRDLMSSAEEQAKREDRGMWANCGYEQAKSGQEQDLGPTDPDCIIKGNISEKGFGKTYLVPGCDNYKSVKIDTRKGEQYFCTEEEAIKAEFRKATNCP